MDSCGDEASGWDRKGGSRKRCGLDTPSVSERRHWKSSDQVFGLKTGLDFGHLVMAPAGHTQHRGTLVGHAGHLGSPGSPEWGRMRTAMTRQ